jgi:hypothetical protein
MIRKLVVTAAIVLVGGYLLVGRNLASYVRTGWADATDAVRSAVPVDFEIRRARSMLADLAPEVHKNMLAIAEEEVGLERLDKEIAQHETRLGKERVEIVRMKDDVASGKPKIRYAGREYTLGEVKTDLARRFARLQTNDETVSNMRKMHATRTQSLAAARDKLNGMLAAKRQLELEVEQLASRQKLVEAAGASSKLCLDDGSLSRTRRLIQDVEARLTVTERLYAAEGQAASEIEIGGVDEENIVDEVAAYLESHGLETPDGDSTSVKVADAAK